MPSQERGWGLSRQNSGAGSGAGAASAAAVAVSKSRPQLRVVPTGNNAPPGTRRVWVRKKGSPATSILVEADDLVDDLKTKVLARFPTTLMRSCDPSDLTIILPDEVTKTLRSASSPGPNNRKRNSVSSSSNPPSLSSGGSAAHSPGGPLLSPQLLSLQLRPDDTVFAVLDRYYPNGMVMAEAFEVVTTSSTTPGEERPLPHAPQMVPRNFKFRTNPPEGRPNFGRAGSQHLRQQQQQQQQQQQLEKPAPVEKPPAPRPQSPAQTSPRTLAPVNSGKDEKQAESNGTADNGVLLLPRQLRLGESKRVPDEQHTEDSSEVTTAHTPSSPVDFDVTLTHMSPNTKIFEETVVVPQINVLIVEDNVINQKILEAFMRRKNVRFGVAKNGREAVAKWREGLYHLILMDIQLPVMTGLEATKEIRRLEFINRIGAFSHSEAPSAPPTADDELDKKEFKSPVIIVALTASSASKDKSEALAAGCNDFLTKPVNLLWLEQKIVEWGCMQALIDFEGWKQWIRKSVDSKSSAASPNTATAQGSAPNSPNGEPSRGRRRPVGSPDGPRVRSSRSRLLHPLPSRSPTSIVQDAQTRSKSRPRLEHLKSDQHKLEHHKLEVHKLEIKSEQHKLEPKSEQHPPEHSNPVVPATTGTN